MKKIKIDFDVWFKQWRGELWKHKFIILLSLFFLLIAGVFYYFAGIYTNEAGQNVVPDLILDNFGPIDFVLLKWIYNYGFLFVLLGLIAYPLFLKIKHLSFVISQLSLIIMVRNFFICLTHMKTPLDAVPYEFPSVLNILSFQNDLFFSGHVAVPFLGFLLFKGEKIRWVFLITSIIMGFSVLAMHMHYSIDIFSAFFITYGVYKIGNWIFKRLK